MTDTLNPPVPAVAGAASEALSPARTGAAARDLFGGTDGTLQASQEDRDSLDEDDVLLALRLEECLLAGLALE